MVDEISENVLKRGCLVKNVVLKTDILIVTFLQCNFFLGVHAFYKKVSHASSTRLS